MCGRFALYSEPKIIKETFNIQQLPLFAAQYNITPNQNVLCIYSNHQHSEATLMYWGLIPFWAKDKSISRNLINARMDSVATKPAFRHAFKSHRCLVIMSGFYEWKVVHGKKQPWYFKRKDNLPIAIAALWETWEDKQHNETIHSCCLITTDANQMMKPIHDRMPVIFEQSQQQIWLNHETYNKDALSKALASHSTYEISGYPVTTKVNNPKFNVKEAIEPSNS